MCGFYKCKIGKTIKFYICIGNAVVRDYIPFLGIKPLIWQKQHNYNGSYSSEESKNGHKYTQKIIAPQYNFVNIFAAIAT